MKLSEVAVDSSRVEGGAWVDDVPDMSGLRLKVRGRENKDWRRLQAKLLNQVPRKKKSGGQIDPDEADRIISRCLIDTCLLDWEGLTDNEGKPIPYSKEFAEKLCLDPDYRRFREAVWTAAAQVGEQTVADIEEAAGNLVRLSAGNTDTERKSKAG